MTTFSQNVTDRSDTQKSAHFREKTVKKCQFLHFPLGLDKGLGHSCPLCPCVVSECVSGVKNSHFLQKPLGLDRVLDKISQKPLIPLFFMVFHGFAEMSVPLGLDRDFAQEMSKLTPLLAPQ